MGLELAAQEGEKAAPAPLVTWHRLEVAGVTHVFQRADHEGEFVLGPIDLELEPGELVFLVGGNGSGKTTLAKILSGLYVPDQGEIRLDGQRVTDENRDAYRQLFSAVFFDFYLFQTLLGQEQADLDGTAADLLAQLQLKGKVRVDQSRLSTTDLSQGQRKRLALLSALLESRPIYLFDEWAADQDPRFKEIFYRHLLPKLKSAGKTALVITHDDRYFEVADRVIKLEEGRIVHAESVAVPHGSPAASTARDAAWTSVTHAV
jgi:putative ATP-binding cassette transporter